MSEYERRDNTRLDRIEEKVDKATAIITNGLGDRTKRTEAKLNELHNDHQGLGTKLDKHIYTEGIKSIELIGMVKCLKRISYAGIALAFTTMASLIIWLVIHSPELAAIVEHIKSITGQ